MMSKKSSFVRLNRRSEDENYHSTYTAFMPDW